MSIRRPSAFHALLALVALAPLAACGGGDAMRSFGLTRDAPDEFQVTTRAPLSMPPSLGALPVPRPGAVRPQELDQRQQAEAALVPGAALGRGGSARSSSGESALLSAAGGQPVTGDIRRRVDEESLRLDRPDSSFVDSLMFWRAADPAGTAVDPRRESQRLRENAALGRETGEGETPVIQPARSQNPVVRVFESIF